MTNRTSRGSRSGPFDQIIPLRALLARLRKSPLVWLLMVVAPLPISIALIVTARPVYPENACYYGAPASSEQATDDYLALMTPLAMFAMALVAFVALPNRGRWVVLAPAVTVWAAATLIWPEAGHLVAVIGGNVAVFGSLLALVILVIVVIAGHESSWVRALGWFEFAFLLPMLLGVASLIAQPGCYSGDPVAPMPQ